MLSHLNQHLIEARNRVDRLAKLERQVQSLEKEQAELQQQVKQLQSRLAHQQQDVARLERISLTSLFLTLVGKKEDRLETSQQEVVSTTLKLRQAEHRLKDVTADLAALQQEVSTLQGARAQYERLLAEKEAAIEASGGPAAETLLRLDERERQIAWQIQQIREAQQAAQEAEVALSRVEESLESAEEWGTWDLLGGGMIATAIKHSEMDDAEEAAAAAQSALDRLRRELQDVAEVTPVVGDVSVDSFLRFADYFFDGLLADWMVQSRISSSLERARSSRRQVASLMVHLHERLSQANAELERVRQERREFLTGTL